MTQPILQPNALGAQVLDDALAELQRSVQGEVRADRFTRYMYSTDGSVYEVEPVGVFFPRHEADVLQAVAWARRHGIPLLPRGAATSLAGQTVGRALVLDFTKHMKEVLSFSPEERRMVVQPGMVCDAVNALAARHGLRFAPDPSTSNRATIGGMVGNNASGARSIRYGTTADCIAGLRVVLANGEVIETRPLDVEGEELARILAQDTLEAHIYRTVLAVTSEYAGDIAARFPQIPRNVSGYQLQQVVRDGWVDLTRLFCGSEGTLGIVVAATLKLEPVPAHRGMVVLGFADLVTAMEAVEPLRQAQPSAIELVDRLLLDLAKQTPYRRVAEGLPPEVQGLLVVEVEDDDQAAVAGAVAAIRWSELGAIFHEVRLDPAAQGEVWQMRKAAVPLLYRMPGDPKPVPFIEDMAVAPAVLPQYVRGLQELFRRYEVESVIYAHASVGCLHLRPILNLKDPGDVERMAAIARDACRLVMSLGGVMSGEHGDGLARTQWNRYLYGDRLWEAFGRVKAACDPRSLLNPGKVYAQEADLTQNLRYAGPYSRWDEPTTMDFAPWGTLQQAVELCNGCGHCRKPTGTMCPTFRALDEEIMTTRGRANLIRGALAGRLGAGALFSEEFQRQVLEYCIGCKGCRVECPAGVDLTRIKAEILHQRHRRLGAPLWSRLMANLRDLYKWGSATAPVSNWLAGSAVVRGLAEGLLGIDRRRPLPQFAPTTFSAALAGAGMGPPAGHGSSGPAATRRVLLFADCFTEYNEPSLGLAAAQLLAEAGCRVRLAPASRCCGRPAVSEGMLEDARPMMEDNVTALLPYVEAGWDVVVLEPSCTSAFRHELRELLGFDHAGAGGVSARTFGIMEYLDRLLAEGSLEDLAAEARSRVQGGAMGRVLNQAQAPASPAGDEPPARLTYHGHCHQKSMLAHHATARVLEAFTGLPVDVVDSGCCGMAGSFGYKKEHYDFSARMARPVKEAVDASGGLLVADGMSCRTQFQDLYRQQALHPVAVLARLLADSRKES